MRLREHILERLEPRRVAPACTIQAWDPWAALRRPRASIMIVTIATLCSALRVRGSSLTKTGVQPARVHIGPVPSFESKLHCVTACASPGPKRDSDPALGCTRARGRRPNPSHDSESWTRSSGPGCIMIYSARFESDPRRLTAQPAITNESFSRRILRLDNVRSQPGSPAQWLRLPGPEGAPMVVSESLATVPR